jgi:integrase
VHETQFFRFGRGSVLLKPQYLAINAMHTTMNRRTKLRTHPLVEQTLDRLERYCAGGKGRQSQVAKMLFLHPSQVGRWLSRGGTPRLLTFCELLDFLDSQIPPQNKTQ